MPSAEHHKQNPNSDHELGNAVDITHDPQHGVDCEQLAADLIASKDPRIKYLIWNRRIWFPTANGPRPQGWSAYHGLSAHTEHIHISIKADARNDVAPWPWSDHTLGDHPVLKFGSSGAAVKELQIKLGIPADSQFGIQTKKALLAFQTARKLPVTGICDDATWKALGV
jgi:peptidoglycan hydrolase-like protein with peptidoglycan-binding domain